MPGDERPFGRAGDAEQPEARLHRVGGSAGARSAGALAGPGQFQVPPVEGGVDASVSADMGVSLSFRGCAAVGSGQVVVADPLTRVETVVDHPGVDEFVVPFGPVVSVGGQERGLTIGGPQRSPLFERLPGDVVVVE